MLVPRSPMHKTRFLLWKSVCKCVCAYTCTWGRCSCDTCSGRPEKWACRIHDHDCNPTRCIQAWNSSFHVNTSNYCMLYVCCCTCIHMNMPMRAHYFRDLLTCICRFGYMTCAWHMTCSDTCTWLVQTHDLCRHMTCADTWLVQTHDLCRHMTCAHMTCAEAKFGGMMSELILWTQRIESFDRRICYVQNYVYVQTSLWHANEFFKNVCMQVELKRKCIKEEKRCLVRVQAYSWHDTGPPAVSRTSGEGWATRCPILSIISGRCASNFGPRALHKLWRAELAASCWRCAHAHTWGAHVHLPWGTQVLCRFGAVQYPHLSLLCELPKC